MWPLARMRRQQRRQYMHLGVFILSWPSLDLEQLFLNCRGRPIVSARRISALSLANLVVHPVSHWAGQFQSFPQAGPSPLTVLSETVCFNVKSKRT